VSAGSSLAEKHDTETHSPLTAASVPPRQKDVNGCMEKKGPEVSGKSFSKNSAESEPTADVRGLRLKQCGKATCSRGTGVGNI